MKKKLQQKCKLDDTVEKQKLKSEGCKFPHWASFPYVYASQDGVY